MDKVYDDGFGFNDFLKTSLKGNMNTDLQIKKTSRSIYIIVWFTLIYVSISHFY